MKNLSLGWKAVLLIMANVVLSFALGLLARDLILNPKLAEVERENDQRVMGQLTTLKEFLKRSQQVAITEIVSLLDRPLVPSGQTSWQAFGQVFDRIQFEGKVHFGIAAKRDGELYQVRMAGQPDQEVAPTKADIRDILNNVTAYISHHPEQTLFSTALMLRSGPVILSVGVRQEAGDKEPFFIVLVYRVNAQFVREIAQEFGLHIQLIGLDTYREIQDEERALSGIRSVSDRATWAVNDWQGNPVITAEVLLPPKSYDDNLLTPAILMALLTSLAIWGVAIVVLHRTLIRPIVRLSDTLKEILKDKNYDRRVEHPYRDEMGRLIHYCNQLLQMVSSQTAELRQMSLTDTLTGLNNRRGFEVNAEKFWELARRSGENVGLIALDIDYFKRYNDTYGHPAGDKVIQQVATIIAQVFKRAVDVTARVGGEEFVILTLNASPARLQQLAEKVQEKLRRQQIEHKGNETQGIVTASLGALSIKVSDSVELVDALNQVDELLYEAKAQGRNCVVYRNAG